MAKSMTDVAYDYLLNYKEGVEFLSLWNEVNSVLNFSDNLKNTKRAQLYSELMLDNRFAYIDDKWDLRNRRKFDEVFIDTSTIDIDDEESIDEDEELDETLVEDEEY